MKASHVFLACLMFSSVVSGQSTNCAAPPHGVVSWWCAENNALDAWDSNHGTAANPTNYSAGKAGQAFRGIVYVPDSPSLRFTNALTIEAWVNPSRIDGLRTIVSKLGARVPLLGLNVSNSYYLGISGGVLRFSISTNGVDPMNVLLRSAHVVPTNQWTHVAATFAAGTMRLYINGREDAKASVAGMIFPSDAQLGIGGVPYPNGDFVPGPSSLFDGKIDELAVYNRELSGAEIRALFVVDSAGKCPPTQAGCVMPPAGLVSWWRGERNATDNWGGNDGVPYVSMRDAAGKVGQAFSLDYFSVVAVPDSASLRLTNGLTIEGWVNPSSQVVTGAFPRTLISKFSNPYDRRTLQSAFYLGTTTNRSLYFAVSTNGSPLTNISLTSAQTLAPGVWSHVAAVYDGLALRLYLNGSQVAATNFAGRIFPGMADLGIGTIASGTRSLWPTIGTVDEISIYNRGLSPAEVLAIFQVGAAGKCLAGPQITLSPQDQTIPLGEDVKFAVTVAGSRPFTYQWWFNGSVIPGATNAALVLEKVETNHAGFYHVQVTNAAGFAISGRAQLGLLPAPSCTQVPVGPISWWPADGNSADAMGNNNATYGPALYPTGKVDRAFSLSGQYYNRIFVPNSLSLNFNTNADFSIEMWIKMGNSNTTYANVPLFEKRQPYFDLLPIPPSWIGYSLSLDQGRLAFALGNRSGLIPGISSYVSPGPDLRDAVFHHVAVSVNRQATKGGNLYVDGAAVLTFDPTPRNGNLTTSAALLIGTAADPTTNSSFSGLIDEPAIYGRALSAAEILAIRNAGAVGRCKVRPLIVTQPVSRRVTVGSNVTFTVLADGTPKLRYQWLRNDNNVASGTNATLSVLASGLSAGSYSVRVTNLFGAVVSSNAVLAVNFVPTVMHRSVTTVEDTPTNILVSAFDPNKADLLTFAIITPPQHGTLGPLTNLPAIQTTAAASTTYTPSRDYNGPDSFTFKVNDGLVDSAPATVSITVLPVNDAPVAQSQVVALDEDTALNLTLGAFDVDGDALSYTVGALPAHGNLSGVAPNLVYQPATNYFGPDSFAFSVNDGRTNSNPAMVSLTVLPVNDAPIASIAVSPLVTNVPGWSNLVVIAAVCDAARVVLDGSGSSDVEQDPLTYSWWEGTNQLSAGVLATNRLCPGSHEISLQVSDGQVVGEATATIEVLSPAQGVGIVTLLVHESELGRRNAQPLIVSLRSAAAAFDRCQAKAGVNQLEAFKHKVRTQVEPLNPELAARLTTAVDQVIAATR